MAPYKGTIETLGDLKAHDIGLNAHCSAPDTGHSGPLDIDMLIERFGADYIFIGDRRIGAACVCKVCGHRGARVMLAPDTRPSTYIKGS